MDEMADGCRLGYGRRAKLQSTAPARTPACRSISRMPARKWSVLAYANLQMG